MIIRRGKTLIEMLILMTVLSTVLAGVSLVLLGAFKTDRQLRRDLAQQTSLARLASRFRSDAHAATTCRVDNACELSLADGRVDVRVRMLDGHRTLAKSTPAAVRAATSGAIPAMRSRCSIASRRRWPCGFARRASTRGAFRWT